jgi:thioesterase domain-containing protein/acyl carrier protein
MDQRLPPGSTASATPRKKPARILRPMRRSDLPVQAEYVAPNTDLEIRLAELWRDSLNVDMVGSLDDYFDLGGDSLTTIELFLEIERWIGVRLAQSTILEHSTVADLVALLNGEVQTYAKRCLMPLQKEGASPPLFLPHDRTGGLMAYRHLLRCLDARRKVFGLQYPGQNESLTPAMSIPEMATAYVDAIRAAWPRGPYYLAGYSLGGQIAFEMASQLAAAGGEVRLLALIDGPTRNGKVRGLQRLARKVSRDLFLLSEERPGHWPAYLLDSLRRELLRTWKKRRQRQREETPQDLTVLLMKQSEKYVPPIYRGPVKMLRCAEGGGYWSNRYLGWDKYISGPIEVFDIGADHTAIMTEPMASLVAAYLEGWMREADRAGPVERPGSGQ